LTLIDNLGDTRRITIQDGNTKAIGAEPPEGLRTMLPPHVDVAGVASDGPELVVDAKGVDLEVLFLDVSGPSLNANDIARDLRIAGTRAKLIILSLHREVTHATRVLEAGASVFVLKHSAASQLVTAIGEALKEGTHITNQMAAELIETCQRSVPVDTESSGELTPRQRQVLEFAAKGLSAKEIAAELGISRRTAEYHKARIMDSLGLQNVAELVQYAIREGIISV
jgi:DNA-binding NarL/FixJ family response regulator